MYVSSANLKVYETKLPYVFTTSFISSFINLNLMLLNISIYKMYKKFIKSKLPNRPNRPKPTQIIDSVSYEVLSFRNLSWFDLVTLTFHENSNHGWKNSWKSGVRIPAQKDQILFVLCLFLFKFSVKNVFDFNQPFLNIFLQIRYQ